MNTIKGISVKTKEEIYHEIYKHTSKIEFYLDEINKTNLEFKDINDYSVEIQYHLNILKTLAWVLGLSAIVINGEQIKVAVDGL